MSGMIARSAKGELVDLDLLKIKQTLASSPAPTEVAAREDFIEKRLSRRKRLAEMQLAEIAAAGKDAAINRSIPQDPPQVQQPAPQPEKKSTRVGVKKSLPPLEEPTEFGEE